MVRAAFSPHHPLRGSFPSRGSRCCVSSSLSPKENAPCIQSRIQRTGYTVVPPHIRCLFGDSLVGSNQTVALYRARPSSPTGPKAVWKAARKGISISGPLCLAPTGSSLKGYLSDMYLVSSSRWGEIMILTLAQDGCSVNAFVRKNIEKTYFFLPNVQYLLTRKLIGMVTARLMNGASHSGMPTISTHSASSSWFKTNAPPYAARDLKYMRT